MRICGTLLVLLFLFVNRSGLCQCGTVLSMQRPSIELRVSDSTVLHAGRTYRLLMGTPAHDDTASTFSQGHVDGRYVAFYPNGHPAFMEEREEQGYRKAWYYESGQMRNSDSLSHLDKHRIARVQMAFFRDGSRDELDIINDTIDYYLDLDMDGDTTQYSFTDLRKGAAPYRVVISSACGKRKEVRFYSTRKKRYAFQYFEGGGLQEFGVCEDPELALLTLLYGR